MTERDDEIMDEQSESGSAEYGRRPKHERKERRLRDIAKRILSDRERDKGERDFQDMARDAVNTILETGDRAKTEFVRLFAREMRHYLTELRVGEGVHHLLTNYSLEFHTSINLRPLNEQPENPEQEVVQDDPAQETPDETDHG